MESKLPNWIGVLCMLFVACVANGAGVEYYFGFQLLENDLVGDDFCSRDESWDYCGIALDFFRDEKIPFKKMACADALMGNPISDNCRYCLAKAGEAYLVYLPRGGAVDLDLSGASGEFHVKWFNPRAGGPLADGTPGKVQGGSKASLGPSPQDTNQDWLIVVRRVGQ